MHRLTKEALKRLKADNIPISSEDAIELEQYAVGTDNVSDTKLLLHSGKYIGNIEVFPLSLGAKTWLKTDAHKWFQLDERMYYLCLLYSYCYSRYEDRFVFKSAWQCRKKIIKWAKTVDATEEEIINAFEKEAITETDTILKDLYNNIINNPLNINLVPMINHLTKLDVEEKDSGTTPIVSWLISNFGKDVSYWLWGLAWDTIEDMINAKVEHETGNEQIDPKDPSILSMFAFQKKLNLIRNR